MTLRDDDAIRVVEYDADWPLRFQTLAARVRSLLGARVARVEHIGSTSVPGLVAKPILDIDVVVRAAADLQPSIHELEKAGYRYEGDLGVAGREALRRPPDSEHHHRRSHGRDRPRRLEPLGAGRYEASRVGRTAANVDICAAIRERSDVIFNA